MSRIKNRVERLSTRIATAESRVPDYLARAAHDAAWVFAAKVLRAFVSADCGIETSPDVVVANMLAADIDEGAARRYATMGFHAARDEVTALASNRG